MSKHVATLVTNESVFLCTASRGTLMDMYEVTVFATDGGGNGFNTGDVTIQASPNEGANLVTLKDDGGNVVTYSEDDVFNIRLGYAGKLGEEIQIFATMLGAAGSTNVLVSAFDNR